MTPAQAPAVAPAAKIVKSVKVAFSIKLPSADKITVLKRRLAKTVATRRIPQYISQATYSFTIAVNGITAPGGVIPCSSGTCQGIVSAPVGTDTFSISFFDQAGNLLQAGTSAPQNITATGVNTVNISCDGVPVTGEILSAAPTSFAIGTPAAIPFTFWFWDADVYQIFGNLHNISVVMSDSVPAEASHFTLPVPSSFTDSTSVTLSYDGGVVTPQSTVTLSLLYSPPGSPVVVLDNQTVAIGPTPTPVPTPTPAGVPTPIVPSPVPTVAPTPTPTPTPVPASMP